MDWISRWGFGVAVVVAAVLGAGVGTTVSLPSDIPGVALQAAPVYRLEVGAAIFVGLYVVAMALVLAFQNRGFTEIGSGGVRAHDLTELPRALLTQEGALNVLLEVVDELEDLRVDREEN